MLTISTEQLLFMIFAKLSICDVDEVFQLLNQDSLQGIHKPSYYTVSSLVQLYGDICGSVRVGGCIAAVSINCPFLHGSGVHVYVFAVNNEQQRKGVGCFMFSSMVKVLREMDYEKISLRVLTSNQLALRFWKKMGFTFIPMQFLDTNDAFAENFLEISL